MGSRSTVVCCVSSSARRLRWRPERSSWCECDDAADAPPGRNGMGGPEVTALGLGTVGIGNYNGLITDEEAVAVLRRAVELGINHVDTSPSVLYGGRGTHRPLAQGARQAGGLILSTKLGAHPARL